MSDRFERALIYVLAAFTSWSLGACGSDGGGDDGPGTVTDLGVGSCVTTGAVVALTEVETSPCTAAHRWEVIGSVSMGAADAAFPGRRALLQDSYRACVPLVEGYTGEVLWGSDLDLETITPSVRAWAEGSRDALCLLGAADGEPLTASVRQPLGSATP